jgi:hypothetical protein
LRSRLAPALLVATTLLLAAPASAADDTAGAVDAAKAYVARLKSGEIKQAVGELWDVDALLTSSFGLVYLELPEAERTRSQSAFADFVAAPFSSPRITELFKGIEVQEAMPRRIDASTVAVRMQLTGDGGNFKAVNTLLLARRDASWRIIDQRQGEQPSIRVALPVAYMSAAKGPTDTIPIVLERVAADTRKQMSTR